MTETNNQDIDESLLNGQLRPEDTFNKTRVYVIELSFGFMEDYYTVINGIFDNPLEAENIAKKITDQAKYIQSLCPKYIEDDDESYDLYWEYCLKNKHAMDFNNAVVIEFEINKSKSIDWTAGI